MMVLTKGITVTMHVPYHYNVGDFRKEKNPNN